MASGERSGRSTVVRFLGLRCDSLLKAFLLPDDKKLTFETLREKTLFSPSVGFFVIIIIIMIIIIIITLFIISSKRLFSLIQNVKYQNLVLKKYP